MKKKIFISALIIIILVVAMLVSVPAISKNRVESLIYEYMSKRLNADMTFSSHLGFSRHFPNLSLEMNDVVVIAKTFDTVAVAKRVDVVVDLPAAFKKNDLEIKEVIVKDGAVTVVDVTNNREIYLYNVEMSMEGDIKSPGMPINVDFSAGDVTYLDNNIIYLHNADVVADIEVVSDVSGKRFVLGDNSISINDLPLVLDGSVGLAGKRIDPNISFVSERASLSTIAATLLPITLSTEYEFSGYGIISGSIPFCDVNMSVEEGTVSFLDSEGEIESISLDGLVETVISGDSMQATFKLNSLKYVDIEAYNLSGLVSANDSEVILNGVTFEMFDGLVNVDGSLLNAGQGDVHSLKADMAFLNVNIDKAASSLASLKIFIPSEEKITGQVDMTADIESLLDEHYALQPYTIKGGGTVRSKEITIEESSTFEHMKQVLQLGENYTSSFKDINIDYTISNGRMYVKPFDTQVGNLKMNVSGDHGIDKTLNYLIKTEMPRKDLGSSVNSLINIFSKAASSFGFAVPAEDVMKVNIKITGSFDKPVITPLL